MAEQRSRRLVLSSGFANQRLDDVLRVTGWLYLGSFPPGQTEATEHVWLMEQDHTFHYFECVDYPVEYCQVFGPSANDFLRQISIRLDFLDVDDLSAAFDRSATPEEKRTTTFALGLASGAKFDPTIYERIHESFQDVNSSVRIAAIDAAFVTGWGAFRPSIEHLAVFDSDPVVSRTAAIALGSFPND
jgi:hypothetical protein